MNVRATILAALAALVLVGCPDSEVDGVSVYYTLPDGRELSATYKRPSSAVDVPTMLLLHQPGDNNNRRDFDELWEALLTEGYALLAPDLASHGLSDSAGAWQDLATDPEVYPQDVMAWLDWIESHEDEEPITRSAVGIIGLGTSGSLGAAALGKGHVDCAVAVSARIEELNALHPGFPIYEPPGDDDDSGSSARDDDDSAADDDDDDSAADDDDDDDDDSAADDDDDDDDDSSIGDDDDVAVDDELELHTIRWIVGTLDLGPAEDAQALADATTDGDLVQYDTVDHGVELIWLGDDSKLAMLQWCGDKF
jgi:pimeloyl-ACP methyl ester carboxylesterase